MDDNFTTGPDDRHNELMAALRELLKDRQELTRTMRASFNSLNDQMDRTIERIRPPSLSADKQALIDLRRDYANIWEMYANAQKRIDRLEGRVEELERKLEPPLPPFPDFKS